MARATLRHSVKPDPHDSPISGIGLHWGGGHDFTFHRSFTMTPKLTGIDQTSANDLDSWQKSRSIQYY